MPQKSEYKLVSGFARTVQDQVTQLALQDWRPIMMSTTSTEGGGLNAVIVVLLEHVHEYPGGGFTIQDDPGT
jgi:hypothetical protein